ncbi:MarR family winged helix-turn-helix transcriptional regulator [Sanguibacter sp. HDW7]|uniref:MarR family winged helix-turn-helix transcriptional regulator n=1 Tax=Sanguibacter sp. HDW7 TaxID=2714931 RepID=UPI001407753F|nr:MarR family transcriptional regulator [Sanguibacter sp. HDW7]QIK83045.1 MarR family transcriptional regulator [Sanguibacter sp. HDW7]
MTTHERTPDQPVWLRDDELRAWVRFIGVVELLPGILDSQLQRDSGLSHFEYYTLAILSEAPGRTLRMTGLAARTNSTLPRLSHVVTRLEKRGLVARAECPEDRRAMNATLTDDGWQTVVAAAPGHAAQVRDSVFAALTPQDVADLHRLSDTILERIDPEGRRSLPYEG